jgi:hypothetical protein
MDIVIELILVVVLSYLNGRLQQKKLDSVAKDDKPTTTSTRGSYSNWFLGERRLGPVFAWAGNRHIHKEDVPGGKGPELGGKPLQSAVYYEDGVHVVSVGYVDEIRSIQMGGKTLFAGPITRENWPSGTGFDLGKEGGFYIWWGEDGGSLTGDVPPTDPFLGDASRLDIPSRFPLHCRFVWINKRLGTQAVWPLIDYTLFRKCHYSDALLPSTDSYIPSTFTLTGATFPIVDRVNGVQGTGYFTTTADIGLVTTEPGIHYKASVIKDGDKLEMVGNSMADQTLDVLFTEVTDSPLHPLLGVPQTKIFPVGGVTGANTSGTLQQYVRAHDDGLNPAHVIAETLFAPWPLGLGLDTADWNLTSGGNSLDALGVLCAAEGLKASIMAKDGQTAAELVAGVLQDIGVVCPVNNQTGLIDFVAIRDESANTLETITTDMQAGTFPEIETPQGELPISTTIFTFTDRANFFREMTVSIAADGQAQYVGNQRAENVQMPSVIDFDVGAKVSERRMQELMAGGASYKLTGNRGTRKLMPGQTVHVDGVSELVRLTSIQLKPDSGEVDIGGVADFMGAKTSGLAIDPPIPSGLPGSLTAADAPLQFDPVQIPAAYLNGNPTTLLVPQVRASSAVASTVAYISPDDATYYEVSSTLTAQAGGTTTGTLTNVATTGCNFDSLGPDIGTVLDLSSDSASFNAGRQLLLIVSGAGTEVCFVDSITSLGGNSYSLNNLVRAQFGTTALTHGSGARVYIFQQNDPVAIQDVLLVPAATVYVKMVPTGLTLADVTSKSVVIA